MKKVMIVLKTGVVKKYPWDKIYFGISDDCVWVRERNPGRRFIFQAPMGNIEYCEAIEEDEEEGDDYDVVFSN